MKQCTKCHILKEIKEFYKAHNNGYRAICKECSNRFHNEYVKKRKESGLFKKQTLSEEEKLEILTKKREWYQQHKDLISVRNKEKYNNNKDLYAARNKKWRDKNKQYHFKRIMERIDSGDIELKIRINLRSRLSMALKNNQKTGSAVKDLGCSINELKTYLESKFLPGMTWDNYGRKGWHIDHIEALANFNLTDQKQLKEACKYTNLQPLWWYDNLSKGSK